jgi:hypothetical protein
MILILVSILLLILIVGLTHRNLVKKWWDEIRKQYQFRKEVRRQRYFMPSLRVINPYGSIPQSELMQCVVCGNRFPRSARYCDVCDTSYGNLEPFNPSG